jgi:ribulose-5-phosphate 4-epimerase/fuculose-1-phosphate aldolase
MAAEVAGPVASALDGHRICLVQGHGCYAFAPDLWTAFQWVTVLEEASQIIYLMESLTAKH